MSHTTAPSGASAPQGPCRTYRVERRFASPRRPRELAEDLLRAHWGS